MEQITLDGSPVLSPDRIKKIMELRPYKAVFVNNRFVGSIYNFQGLGKIYITVRSEDELLRKFNSFGISNDVIRVLRAENVKYVVIYTGNATFISTLEDWITKGAFYYWSEGKELQTHLRIEYMQAFRA